MSTPTRRRGVSPAVRWNALGVLVVVLLVVALWPRGQGDPQPTGSTASATSSTAAPDAAAPTGDLGAERAAADLAPCPSAGAAAGQGPLAGLVLPCLADGAPVDLAAALAGRPALLNVWAWWCGPCRAELPAVQDFAARAGGAVTVLTVHADPQTGGGLARLADYGVRLPGVEDADGRVAALVGAPQVLPTTVLLRADGTVARTLSQPFASADEIAAAVADGLGVRV